MGDNQFEEIGFENGLAVPLPSNIAACWSGMNQFGHPDPSVQGVAFAHQDNGNNAFIIPPGMRVKGYRGSIVIKQPGVELLWRICSGMGADFDSIDQRHNITPLLNQGVGDPKTDVEVTDVPSNVHLTGDGYRGVWVEWQAINATGTVIAAGRAFEVQLTFDLVPA